MNADYSNELHKRVINHVNQIYPEHSAEELSMKFIKCMGLDKHYDEPMQHKNHWDEHDIAVITYANTFMHAGQTPLHTLKKFLSENLKETVSIVHILPFFPFSSDDGFSVIDYTLVNDAHGDWNDIEDIAGEFKLMSDLVINHCSSRGRWFEQFKAGKSPGKDYFFQVNPDEDLAAVVRPRTNPLLKEVTTLNGEVYVWCTFSHDQIDLNFSNPDVLLEFVNIIRLYLERGVKVFRLDAIAFLWKEIGTNCINLPQTHEIVRLLRTLIEYHTNDAIIITETNIPNRENLSYFGNANEAHMVYNFPLPPLLLHTLLTGSSKHLKTWLMSMPPAMMGTTYFNFIASHDGIGLRPAEGLLSEEEIQNLVATMEAFGGHISWRALDNGDNKPYEINITLYDALKGTEEKGPDKWQQARFICAHTIMLALEGVPAFYIHSLLATENDYEKYKNTNNNRAINRHNWELQYLESLLESDTHHANIFNELKRIIAIRKLQPAFHPNATQFTLQLGDAICGVWRQNLNRDQSIFAISNVTDQNQRLILSDINLIATDQWIDLISNDEISEEQTELYLKPYQSVWLSNKIKFQ
ncbi:MAG: sugar phosphorylase [Proteobacteria bacterium]|nr:alpha-amylase [Pseudomonadota bacterium]NOG60941.1 sugar phosphorylase [Pseudomonadota bacterium]